MHGWRHEAWSTLRADDERDTLERGLRAFAGLGLEVDGFRPPGGELTPLTPALLHRLGFRWCSPVGDRPEVRDRIALVPFRWELVDAYHLLEGFDRLRGAPVQSAAQTEDALVRALTADRPAVQTLILHPFLMLDPAWWSGVQQAPRADRLAGADRWSAGRSGRRSCRGAVDG